MMESPLCLFFSFLPVFCVFAFFLGTDNGKDGQEKRVMVNILFFKKVAVQLWQSLNLKHVCFFFTWLKEISIDQYGTDILSESYFVSKPLYFWHNWVFKIPRMCTTPIRRLTFVKDSTQKITTELENFNFYFKELFDKSIILY